MATLTVGSGGTYTTIQAAIDAATSGDTISVGAGTFNEHVVVNKTVTIDGANAGIDGNGGRGPETIITGGVKVSAAGSTIDGVTISGSYDTAGTADITAPSHIGLLIGPANVTIQNSVLTGDAFDSRPFGTFGGATGLNFEHNLVQNWNEGAYFTGGSSGSITGNTFVGDANGVFSEVMSSFVVSGNTFSGSAGSDVSGQIGSATFDVGSVVYGNTYISDPAQPISVYLTGASGQTVHGSNVAETIHLEYLSGSATVDGAGGDNVIIGGPGNDTITGGAGNDTIYGGAGVDTAAYNAAINASQITDDGAGHFVVTTGGAEGNDTLSGMEVIDGAGAGNILLVGNGGYATIYAAMSAAQSGDTIMIASGTFNIGDGAPAGQGTFGSVGSGRLPDNVTFVGAGQGQTIIIGNPRIASDTADFGSGVPNGLTLRDMTLQYSNASQYILQWDSGNGGHNLTLQNVTLTGTSNGNAGSGNLSAISGADGLTLDNVTYNVTTTTGGSTTFIFGSGKDITVTGGHYSNVAGSLGGSTVLNIFDSAHTVVSGATFDGANLFLQNADASGTTHSEVDENTFEGGGYLRLNQSSHVVVDTNSFTIEDGAGQGIRISNNNFGPNGAPSDITVTNNSFTAGATAPASAAAIALGAGDQSLPATYPVVNYTDNTVTGLSLETKVAGGTPGEDLTQYATSGNNLIDGGAGNDTIAGGAGNDILAGGTGTDTVHYTGVLATANIKAIADADPITAGSQPGWQVNAVGQGTDVLTGVEKISDDSGHAILLVGNGGYATIGDAIDAASSGDTIVVAPGTWALPGGDSAKQLTFLGANAGVSANDVDSDLNGARGPETIIDGGVTPANFRFESGGGTFDGFTFTHQHFDTYVAGADVAFRNNIITNPGTSVLYTLGGPDTVTLENNRITGVTGSSDAVFVSGNWNGTTGTHVSITSNVFANSPERLGLQPQQRHGNHREQHDRRTSRIMAFCSRTTPTSTSRATPSRTSSTPIPRLPPPGAPASAPSTRAVPLG